MSLIRFLLYVLLVYYIVKVIGRIVFPIAFKKSMEQFKKQYGHQEDSPRKEGEVSIESKPEIKSDGERPEGEYIEYEEIDD